MATKDFEDLDSILDKVVLDHVPAEFVSAASITDSDDEVYIVTRDELEEIMLSEDSLEEQGIVEISLILDRKIIKEAINHYAEIILKDVAL